MKVRLDWDEMETFEIVEITDERYANTIPGKLVRRRQKAYDRLAELDREILDLVEAQDDERQREEREEITATTVYQLRQERSGLVILEATTPFGSEFGYDFEYGREPEGFLRWYFRHSTALPETGFEPLGRPFTYIDGRKTDVVDGV